jgi:hypothetical protein
MVKSTLESMNSRICFDLQFTQSYTLSLVVLGHLKGHLNGGGRGRGFSACHRLCHSCSVDDQSKDKKKVL